MCNLSEALIEEGRKIGIEEGMKIGRAELLFKYVQEGIVPLAKAARDIDMSEEEFKSAMREAGYRV